jgi:ubiquitin-protein ligase E3 C
MINREWFLMFTSNEIQTLISGTEASIDVGDLRRHTVYSGGLTERHPTIALFWEVVRDMNDEERHALVKFVTSCRRPPLFGFAQLNPRFCVHGAGEVQERLPTASTCMNLLKLPIFKSREVLEEKLMYAIKSGAGFELS